MNIVSTFLRIQNQLRIFHWQTKSYAQHKAFGKAYEELDGLVDDFIEVFMGKHGRVKAALKYVIELDNFDDASTNEIVDSYIQYLTSLSEDLLPTDTDLLNIRDEMLAVLHRLKYLLTLG